jgi:hypothetical protein
MYKALLLLLLFMAGHVLCGQSKSISHFREDHKENSNMFFYKSTLKMLNTENSSELSDLLKDIEQIRVLNYDLGKQPLSRDVIAGLKKAIRDEKYNNLLMMNDKDNKVELYNCEKRGKTTGFIAIVEKGESLILIDLAGSIDVKKFMELKQKLDVKMGSSL